jgi:hypothetical protein
VLGKVAGIVQKNLSNLKSVQGVGSGLIGGAIAAGFSLMDKAKNSVQVNAEAAKILNKSPLEIDDTSPVAHMKSNPFQYGTVYYPENVQNLGTGHYIIIDILETTTIGAEITSKGLKGIEKGAKKLGADNISSLAKNSSLNLKTGQNTFLKDGTNRISKQLSGINKDARFGRGSRHTRVTDTIILYTPPGIKTNYVVNHSGVETGMMADLVGIGSFADISRVLEVATKAGAEVLQMITQAAPGVGDFKAALQKVSGRAFNNNLEMVFKDVPMREFQYTFEFAPRNRKELDSARKIISLLKFHMHPELGIKNDFVVPSQFQITFMYMDKINGYIPRIAKCVLTKMDLAHGDESVFSTFTSDNVGAAPIHTKMDLTFAETEIMTKQKIAEGF